LQLRKYTLALSVMLVAGVAAPAHADGAFPPVANEAVRSECGDCHIPYQPQMLPQRSWSKLMAGLSDHFGEELELDEKTRQEVLRGLLDAAADQSRQRHAAKFLRGLGPKDAPIRITETPRWKKKHRKLPESVWSDSRIDFKGRCEACHTRSDQGLYDDDDGLRVPGPNGTWRPWEDD
jgi:nitrate/TMAO reductase-like tetraheme cytochrome c subunit